MTYRPAVDGAFADPERHARAHRRGFDGATTVEIGHAETRNGFILRIDALTERRPSTRVILERAFEIAGEMPHRLVCSPGWWTIMVGIAASEHAPCEVMRVPERASRHAVMVVERARGMMDDRPDWPMVRMSPTSPWLDLRGEAALRHGPSTAELTDYAERVGVAIADVVRGFEMGVVEFVPGDPGPNRRRGLQHAGA